MKKFRTRVGAGIAVLTVLVLVGCGTGDGDGTGGAPGAAGTSEAAGTASGAAGAAVTRGSALDRILERGTIRVGTTGDFYMSFIDPETNERRGHDIDLVMKLAEDMEVEVEWVPTDWANLVSGIAAGKYDITTGASFNMGRAKTAGCHPRGIVHAMSRRTR
jgi:cyclohexadienyl dehydratase